MKKKDNSRRRYVTLLKLEQWLAIALYKRQIIQDPPEVSGGFFLFLTVYNVCKWIKQIFINSMESI
ncbi:hypothetical protein A3860_04905 [Niastella vici]|uniref:Uncharacterized protein n=1 Tax=Niastella vici TaxID=1703345 RepID=A0A1V9FRP3_9BACT|nr:hypothetical protein A3860_04905 [Niastella vici]